LSDTNSGSEKNPKSETLVLYTQRQAADYLRLSPRTLERYRCYGGGPRFCKLGRRTMYRESDLRSWVDARVFSNTAEAQQSQVAK
jgi:hypothetical protein